MFLKVFNLFILFLLILSVKNTFAISKANIARIGTHQATRLTAGYAVRKNVQKGKAIVIRSGCAKCHSFIKGKRIDNIETLAGWGNKRLSIKKTEKAIRSCRMDPYCAEILTDKQVRYVAYYLNSLITKNSQKLYR
ncbi:MAG: hypothetical protein ACYDDB_08900 [bacterium]